MRWITDVPDEAIERIGPSSVVLKENWAWKDGVAVKIPKPFEKEFPAKYIGPMKDSDPVNQPSHYTFGRFEVIDVINDWKLAFNLGNAIKYIARAGKKDPSKHIEDLKKARFYLDYEIKKLEQKKLVESKPTTARPISISEAMTVLKSALRIDEGYRIGWQANIAMQFKDEYSRNKIIDEGETKWIHEIANKAADNFLKLLIKD